MPTAPDGTPLEIERTYLLDRLPLLLPPRSPAYRIEQGYLDPTQADVEGRIRRTRKPDGTVTHVHTVKTGMGLVRTEVEKDLTAAEFERLWPATAGRRIVKTRHKVKDGERTWEIDEFEGVDLVLAEVELPSADTEVAIPAWLAPHVVRDVTEESTYRNFEIAKRLGLGTSS
jgi:adenylate cyclase